MANFTLQRNDMKQQMEQVKKKENALSKKEMDLEKLKDITELPPREQKETFQLRYLHKMGEEGYKEIAAITDEFLEVCEKNHAGAKSIAYTNVVFQTFMKEKGLYSDDIEKVEVFKMILDIQLDDTQLSVIQFLLLYYRKAILADYEKRWENASDEVKERKMGKKFVKEKEEKEKAGKDDDENVAPKEGEKEDESVDEELSDEEDSDEEEEDSNGDRIIEEFFQPPLGVDDKLDTAIVKFSEMLAKREQKITEYVKKIRSGGRVASSRAKTELNQFRKKAQDEINKSQIYFSAAIKHVNDKQEADFMKLRSKMEALEEANLTPNKAPETDDPFAKLP